MSFVKFAIIALIALVSEWAGASVTYNVVTPLYLSATAPYTTAMRITGSFTLTSAIPNNQSYYSIPAASITSFNFSDGVNAYTAVNSNTPSIWVTTNGAGDVTLGVNDAILLNSTDEFKSIYIYQSNGSASTYDPVQHMPSRGDFSGTTTITLAQPEQYTIGATVTDLGSGKSVVVQNNGGDNKTVSASGAFTFATAVNSGSSYLVTVLTQPTGQTCTVSNGSGTVSGNVTNIGVSCSATYQLTYHANGHGGTVPSGGVYSSGAQITVGSGTSTLWNSHPARFWNTAANGTGTRYDFGSTLTMPANDVTLYAQWNTVNVNAQIGWTLFDMFSWTIGLGAKDNLGMESASGAPAKHCAVLNIFICNFDPLAFSLPISMNSPVASNMLASNIACKYTDVTAPQIPVTIPWTYFPVPGFFNLAYPGSTTIGWTVADSVDRSYANKVTCNVGLWVIIASPQGQMVAYLNTPENGAAPNSQSSAAAAQSANQASQPSKRIALATTAGSTVSYVANCTSPDGGAPVSGSSNTNIITISGPTPGKRYHCSFTANDGNYTSPAVDSQNEILIAVPTNPTNVVATPSQGNITLSFGSSSGSGTTNYGAICSSSDGGARGYAVGTVSPLTVTGLTSGKSYSCTVSAQDSNGVSQSIDNSNGPVVVFAATAVTAVPVLSEWPQILLMISMIGLIGRYSRRVWR